MIVTVNGVCRGWDYKKDYFSITINKLIKLYFWTGVYGLESDAAVFTFERIPIHTTAGY